MSLVVCPTPIGNLEDVTLRVLSVLRTADVVACEDTRRTRVLLDRHDITADLVSYHEHNEAARAGELLARISTGETVALVSDAGMPLINDPGWELVQACLRAGVRVEVLPGPSAVVTALAVSGLPNETWRFVGFVPRRHPERAFAGPETVVAFESPHRIVATLRALGDRPVAVCRELTKLHEEVVRGPASEVAARLTARGEIVLVVGGAEAEVDVGAAIDAVRRLVAAGARPRAAASVVAELTSVGANVLYRAVST